MDEENSSPPPIPPRTVSPPPVAHPGESDATGGVIPYKNKFALTSYYLGIFSLIPVIGLLLGLLAIIFGFLGWRDYRRNPKLRGQVHCWVGIIIGTLVVLGHLLIIGSIVANAR